MKNSRIIDLARKNRDLRHVVTRLSTIVLRNAAQQRQLAPREASAMNPVERLESLRELSMRSGELREISLRLRQIACRESAAADAFNGLAGEFADEAGQIDALIAATRE